MNASTNDKDLGRLMINNLRLLTSYGIAVLCIFVGVVVYFSLTTPDPETIAESLGDNYEITRYASSVHYSGQPTEGMSSKEHFQAALALLDRQHNEDIISLSIIHAVICLLSWAVGLRLYKELFARAKSQGPTSISDQAVQPRRRLAHHIFPILFAPLKLPWLFSTASNPFQKLQGAFGYRLFFIIAPGWFGAFLCLYDLLCGHLIFTQPIYWLNLVSPAVSIAFLAVTFPARDKLQGILPEVQPDPSEPSSQPL